MNRRSLFKSLTAAIVASSMEVMGWRMEGEEIIVKTRRACIVSDELWAQRAFHMGVMLTLARHEPSAFSELFEDKRPSVN